jgi:superoxide reductase
MTDSVEAQSIKDLANATEAELKHSPNIQIVPGVDDLTVTVTVGLNGLEHPQTEEHYIQWIKVFVGDLLVEENTFDPGQTPEVVVMVEEIDLPIMAQAMCNLHGLWEAHA